MKLQDLMEIFKAGSRRTEKEAYKLIRELIKQGVVVTENKEGCTLYCIKDD